jgi:hypothetical protein
MAGELVAAGSVSAEEALELTPRQVEFFHDRLMALEALRDTRQMSNLLAALSALGPDAQQSIERHMKGLREGAGIELSGEAAGYTKDNVMRL